MKRSVKQIVTTLSLAAALCCLNASKAFAQSIWDGGGADNNWTTDANWNLDTEPANDGTANIQFDGSTRTTPNTDIAWSINSLTFNMGASAFTNSGSQLTIGTGGVLNSSTNIQTVNNAVVLGGSQTWDAATGNLTFGSTVNLGANTLTVQGDNATTLGGAISGTGGINKTGTGTLNLNAANSFSGPVVLTDGTIVAGASGSLPNVNYTIDGGMLNLGTFAATMSQLDGAGGQILGTGSLTVNQAANTSYAGSFNLTGSSVFTKSGAGDLTLTGTNNVTAGGVVVNAGTLTAGTATAFDADVAYTINSTGTLNLNNFNLTTSSLTGNSADAEVQLGSATLTVNQTTNTTYAGDITGTGNLVKQGTGTLILTGINTYGTSGGITTVSAGTLQGDTDSLKGAITNNSTVTFDQATAGTYAGVTSGTGNVNKNGAGNLTITGNNTYSGITTVNAGTLTLGAAERLDNASDLNVNGGTFNLATFNEQVDVVTLTNGSITGTGTLTGSSYDVRNGTISANLGGVAAALNKTTTGTVALAGTNNIGATTVTAGRLDVNGATTTVTATVLAAGTLGGTGRVDGEIVNQGVVSAGTSGSPLGTLRATSYSTNGGTTNVNITTSDNSKLNIDSNATLTGGDVTVNAAAGTYNAGQKFTFLTAGTRTGQFDDISDNIDGLDAVLGYDGGEVFFTLLRNGKTYEAVGRTPNQRAVGAYLDRLSPTATGDLQTVFNGINIISDSQARVAYDQLGGAVHGTLAQVGLQNTTLVINQITSRVRSMPYTAGSPGGGMVGSMAPDVMDLGAASSDSVSPVTLVNCGPDGCGEEVYGCNDYSGCGPTMCCRKTTWSPWAQGFGLGGAAKSDGNASGIEYSMGGVVGGIERWVDDHQLVGWYGGYIGSNVVNDGDQKINGGQFGAYIFTQHENSYTTWLAGAEFDGYTTRRHLDFDGIDRFASADSDGWQGFAYWEHGLAVESCTEVFQPFVALQYVFLRQNSFQESGADSVNLNGDGTDTNSLRGMLGARLQHVLYNHNGRRTLPEVHAMWLHEFLDTNTVLNAQFAGAPGAGGFAVTGLDLGRDWAVLGCNFTWEMHDCWSMFVNYDCQTNSQQTFHVGSGGVGHVW